MTGIIDTAAKLMQIAQNFAFIANGQCEYIKYGNPWKVPTDTEWEI